MLIVCRMHAPLVALAQPFLSVNMALFFHQALWLTYFQLFSLQLPCLSFTLLPRLILLLVHLRQTSQVRLVFKVMELLLLSVSLGLFTHGRKDSCVLDLLQAPLRLLSHWLTFGRAILLGRHGVVSSPLSGTESRRIQLTNCCLSVRCRWRAER